MTQPFRRARRRQFGGHVSAKPSRVLSGGPRHGLGGRRQAVRLVYNPDPRSIPDRWVFNDFGPWAVRYFRDTNRDGRLDAGERLSGEMIHTTPEDEAANAKGERVSLGPSHGCIHVSPRGRDKLMAAGAFERGTPLVVHTYTERLPDGWRP